VAVGHSDEFTPAIWVPIERLGGWEIPSGKLPAQEPPCLGAGQTQTSQETGGSCMAAILKHRYKDGDIYIYNVIMIIG